MKVAFIGLGVMGYPMAGHLARDNHDVSVYNRTTARSAQWLAQYTGRSAATPADAARNADVVFCCVGNDADVRDVVNGEQAVMAGMSQGAVLVDHTTASAELARELHALTATRSMGFLDAPVSGGQAGAQAGNLSIMVGGDQAVFDRVEPVMNCYAKKITRIGEAGSGQLAKMVNQICIAGLVQSLAEALNFAQRAGLDTARVIDAVSQGAAQSWQMDNRWQTMVDGEFDFGFAVDWMRKDLGIAVAEAQRNGASLELTKLVDRYYSEVQAMGGARWDTSSLIARLQTP